MGCRKLSSKKIFNVNQNIFAYYKKFYYICSMKGNKHIRSNGKTAARLRREVARLVGIIKAKNNTDAARESLASIMDENNAIKVTPYLLMQNGWTMHDNAIITEGIKGTFKIVFYKKSNSNINVELHGNNYANRIELRKPSITVGEVNNIMQIFGNSERLQATKLY